MPLGLTIFCHRGLKGKSVAIACVGLLQFRTYGMRIAEFPCVMVPFLYITCGWNQFHDCGFFFSLFGIVRESV